MVGRSNKILHTRTNKHSHTHKCNKHIRVPRTHAAAPRFSVLFTVLIFSPLHSLLVTVETFRNSFWQVSNGQGHKDALGLCKNPCKHLCKHSHVNFHCVPFRKFEAASFLYRFLGERVGLQAAVLGMIFGHIFGTDLGM